MASSLPVKTRAVNISSKKRFYLRKKTLFLYLMFLPTTVLLFVFNYVPLFGILISFKDYEIYRGIFKSEFVGLENYISFLTDEKFWQVMRNTLILNSYDIIFGFTAPIIFALLVNEIYNKRFKKVVQTISYLPYFLSWVVVSGMVISMLSLDKNGLVNSVLVSVFGIKPIYFLAEVKLFRGILVTVDIWKNAGFSAILYFATIAGIDSSLYEASIIDGANRFKQTRYVTLPGMAPIISLMFLLRISSIFTIGFDRVFLLQNPLVYEVSDVISTYIYKVGLQEAQFSLTTAIGFVQSILGFALLYTANKISQKTVNIGLF